MYFQVFYVSFLLYCLYCFIVYIYFLLSILESHNLIRQSSSSYPFTNTRQYWIVS